MKKFAVLFLLLLCACGDPTLTRQDNVFLADMNKYSFHDAKEKSSILYRITHENAAEAARADARKGDYRLISMALGYHAAEKDATVFGVKCTAPVQTQSVVFGCVPPPAVLFKLMLRYNAALIQQPGFPHAGLCQVDPAVSAEIDEMAKQEGEMLKKDATNRIRRWDENALKTRKYNE